MTQLLLQNRDHRERSSVWRELQLAASASAGVSYSLNSRTISTHAFTFSTGVSGKIPCPRLKICPGLDPVRFSNSCTRARSSGIGAISTAGSRFPCTADR